MRPPITRTSCTASSYPPPFSFLACEGGLPTRRIAIPLEYPRVYSGGMSGSTDAAIDVASRFLENLESVIRGKHEEIKLVLAALACRGHVLVDEINRAMPKTQSALLEAMAEHQVTVDGVTRPLIQPFILLATENPVEYEGTFPLPEAQLDRFFVKTALGYPSLEDEFQIVLDQQAEHHPLAGLGAVVTTPEVTQLQDAVRAVYVDELLRRWIVELVRSTREVEMCAIGASVRGTLALERAARAWALLDGPEFVVSDDAEHLFLPLIAHRVGFRPAFRAQARRTGWDDALADFRDACLRLVPAPELRRGQPA